MGKTNIDIIHGIAILHATKPMLRFIFRLDDPVVNEVQKSGLQIVIIFTEILQKLVTLS